MIRCSAAQASIIPSGRLLRKPAMVCGIGFPRLADRRDYRESPALGTMRIASHGQISTGSGLPLGRGRRMHSLQPMQRSASISHHA